MPYIILKRDDIPAGILQILDLSPNESQRNVPNEPFGQTKYINPVANEVIFVTNAAGTITTDTATSGLTAWFITNVADGGGASLTKTEAEANSAAVLDILKFGDLDNAAGVLSLAAVNAAVTGTLSASNLRSMLEVLSGRVYTVPKSVQVETGGSLDVSPAIGATEGPAYGIFRPTYDTGSLTISFNDGKISGFMRSDFVYKDVVTGSNREAIAVYNDDGTLFS